METVETKIIDKYKIQIFPDDDPFNPRGDDNLGTMVLFPKHLGDKNDYQFNDYQSWEEMGLDIAKQENAAVILPLFIYEHSGMTIATTPFSCRWDSGPRGFIFISKEKARKEYSVKRVSKKLKDRLDIYLKAEVQTYDQYLRGDCYGYVITDTEEDSQIDSCWGFFGTDVCMEEAEGMLKSIIAYEEKQLQE